MLQKKLFKPALLSIIGIVSGCQNQAAWLQNGGLPQRVPAPATGSYQVPGQYSNIISPQATNLATSSPANNSVVQQIPFSPIALQTDKTNSASSIAFTAVQPAASFAPVNVSQSTVVAPSQTTVPNISPVQSNTWRAPDL